MVDGEGSRNNRDLISVLFLDGTENPSFNASLPPPPDGAAYVMVCVRAAEVDYESRQ